jgi:transposase-like protein
VIVELSVVEQRYQAVLEVLHDGATVTDVARRHGVARQTVHEWLRRYGSAGLAGLVDGSARPLVSLSAIYRCLVRHGLITPQARKRKRSDYKRWERSRAMELWQMDIVGGVQIVDGSEAKIVSGVDDHSRFCISASVVARATAQPSCPSHRRIHRCASPHR